MTKYIDVDNAVKEAINACNKIFRENGIFLTSLDDVDIAEALDEIPAADVVKVKHGEWLKLDGEWREHGTNRQLIIHQCSCCGMYIKNAPYQYCPHCGAKMDGGRKNDGKG